jgi:hypothetical protein
VVHVAPHATTHFAEFCRHVLSLLSSVHDLWLSFDAIRTRYVASGSLDVCAPSPPRAKSNTVKLRAPCATKTAKSDASATITQTIPTRPHELIAFPFSERSARCRTGDIEDFSKETILHATFGRIIRARHSSSDGRSSPIRGVDGEDEGEGRRFLAKNA